MHTSRQIVELLSEHGVAFSHFDILEDDDVRQGLKKLSNWPTYPQVYAHGELLGGLDVCKDLAETGELAGIAHTCKDEAADAAGAGTEGAVSGAVLEAKVSAALDASLRGAYPSLTFPALPSSYVLFPLDPAVVEEREAGLGAYLGALLRDLPELLKTRHVDEFLQVSARIREVH